MSKSVEEQIREVTRFEVIDDTGRAYVVGEPYGKPVEVELSFQDSGRTLKVFVAQRNKLRSNPNE